MKIIRCREMKWDYNDSENVNIGWCDKFEFKGMGMIHAKIKPKEELKMHYHERNGGDEIFCFFKGGRFRIKTKEKAEEFDTTEPIYVSFSDGEAHAVENLSDKELEFQAIYSPPFKPGEVKQ